MVSLGAGFCTWTCVLTPIQNGSSLLDVHLKHCKSASAALARVCYKLHVVNWLQINLVWTVQHEELMWCAKVSHFLLRPCLFARICHGSHRNTDLESASLGWQNPTG